MSRAFGWLVLAVYVFLCAAALAWWMPHFFASNTQVHIEFTPRYWAASGFFFGLFMLSAAARQAIRERFMFGVAIQVIVCGLLAWAGVVSFGYPPQANFFCPLQVYLCILLTLWNIYQYRRETKQADKVAAA